MDGTVEVINPSENILSFSYYSEPIVTFKADGSVEINPKYTTEEAARKFWDIVKKLVRKDFEREDGEHE